MHHLKRARDVMCVLKSLLRDRKIESKYYTFSSLEQRNAPTQQVQIKKKVASIVTCIRQFFSLNRLHSSRCVASRQYIPSSTTTARWPLSSSLWWKSWVKITRVLFKLAPFETTLMTTIIIIIGSIIIKSNIMVFLLFTAKLLNQA